MICRASTPLVPLSGPSHGCSLTASRTELWGATARKDRTAWDARIGLMDPTYLEVGSFPKEGIDTWKLFPPQFSLLSL